MLTPVKPTLDLVRVKLLVDYLMHHGIRTEGLFRISASAAEQRVFYDTLLCGKYSFQGWILIKYQVMETSMW